MYVFYIYDISLNYEHCHWIQQWQICVVESPYEPCLSIDYKHRQVFMVPGTVDPMED